MTDIQFGPDIVVNGVRPLWLRDDVRVMYFDRHDQCWYGVEIIWRAGEDFWTDAFSIRLPVDHFAYKVFAWNAAHPGEQPFEPWGGGDEAPAKEVADVMLRNGAIYSGMDSTAGRWIHINASSESDIIGYRKRIIAQPVPHYAVSVPRMTEAEIETLWREWLNKPGSGPSCLLWFAKRFGFLKPDPVVTPLDRFMEANRTADRATAELALAWKDGQ